MQICKHKCRNSSTRHFVNHISLNLYTCASQTFRSQFFFFQTFLRNARPSLFSKGLLCQSVLVFLPNANTSQSQLDNFIQFLGYSQPMSPERMYPYNDFSIIPPFIIIDDSNCKIHDTKAGLVH